MTDRTKRLVIVVLALFVLLLTASAELGRRPRALLAQDTATFTPTPTQTPTQTPTPTPTLTLFWTPTPTWTPDFGFATFTPTWTPPFFFSPLETPTPTVVIRVVTEISHPQSGDAVAGVTPILGTALTTSYRRYELFISPAGMENWEWIFGSQNVVHDGHLYALDTTAWPDGYYDLRLRSINDTGEYVEGYLRGLEIRNAYPPTPTPAFDALGTPIPPPPDSPLPTPGPTPRPHIVQYIPDGQGIFTPEVGATVANFVDILGTAVGYYQRPFERYEIAISPAGNGEWQWLYSSQEQVWQDLLYTLNTRDFADGYYDVRLRVVYRDANYDDFVLRYLNIANAGVPDPAVTAPNGIYAPRSGAAVGALVDVVGTAVDPAFARWELYWSPAAAESWAYLTSGDEPVVDRMLARLDLGSLAGTLIDLRLRVVRQDGNYDEYVVGNVQILAATPTPTQPPSPLAGDTPTPTISPTPLG